MSGTGLVRSDVLQRYALAAELCRDLRVLDLGTAPSAAQELIRGSASSVTQAADDGYDVVLALTDDHEEGRASMLGQYAAGGARLLAAFERPAGLATPSRVQISPEELAVQLAERLPTAVVLPQFLAEGSVIGLPGNGGEGRLELGHREVRREDAAAFIVASGFSAEQLSHAQAVLPVTVTPILSSYVRNLESAHAELLRANRMLMRQRVGQSGSAAATLAELRRQADQAKRERDEMEEIARGHELQVHRVRAWYDAPRYHLADRVREALTRLPGFTGTVRFLWSLVSTRAETPKFDAAANPERGDEQAELEEVTREREGRKP
ncbi:MAG TPA: hypothetical protein VFL87_01420, partial [Thermoleophilaceae bacterium]|nr:hypothetical protein [Thermoleophilaceae bacterium]